MKEEYKDRKHTYRRRKSTEAGDKPPFKATEKDKEPSMDKDANLGTGSKEGHHQDLTQLLDLSVATPIVSETV